MRIGSKIWLLLFISIIWQTNIFAGDIYQTPGNDQLIQTIYTTENGLPQNSITSLIQSKDGYIWVGTFDGLARFDGIKFTIFDTSNTPQLINNRITAIYEDKNGILWIRSEAGDVTRYDNGNFTLIKKSEGTPLDSSINSFLTDENNVLWFASSHKLKTYNPVNKYFQTFTKEDFSKDFADPNSTFYIKDLKQDLENNIWIATNFGLYNYKDSKF